MIKVCFVFEEAYTYNPESFIEEFITWVPCVPRKGDAVDFCDFIFTMEGENRRSGLFVVDDVIFDMSESDGSFMSIVISLIPEWMKKESIAS